MYRDSAPTTLLASHLRVAPTLQETALQSNEEFYQKTVFKIKLVSYNSYPHFKFVFTANTKYFLQQ